MIAKSAGIGSNEPISLSSTLTCELRVSLSVKLPNDLRFPELPCKPGRSIKSVSTKSPLWSPFFKVPRVWPSCIAS